MREKVRNTIAKFHMFPGNAKIIVGLSGGMDSVALLHVLCGMKEEKGWDITAVHIHHGLRGAEADADRQFAEKFCASLGVPCLLHFFDVRAEAASRKLGEEETGRLLRYAAFQEAAGEEGYIAVAHHQKDQAETMLMRLCRGTGLKGLAGMAPVRGNICRPLLFCSREEIEAYCRENRLEWREDSTNREEMYTRNKLRLRVFPVLEEINPRAVERMAETAELFSVEDDFLEQQAAICYEGAKLSASEGKVCLSRKNLQELHPAMRKRVLRKAMDAFLKRDVSRVQIDALEDLLQKETGKSRDFQEGVHVENSNDGLFFSIKQEKAEGFCYALPFGKELSVPEAGITVKLWLSEEKAEILEDICTKVFDYDKIDQTIFCRTRKTGDFIRLKNGRKKIKDLFIDEKIPRGERENQPLIVAGEEVLWAPELRVSEGLRADEQTKRFLYIRIRRGQV